MSSRGSSSTPSSVRDRRYHLALRYMCQEICKRGIPLFREFSWYRRQGDPLVLEVRFQYLAEDSIRASLQQPTMFQVGQHWVTGSASFLADSHVRENEELALLDLLWKVHTDVDARNRRNDPGRPPPGYEIQSAGFHDGIEFYYGQRVIRTYT